MKYLKLVILFCLILHSYYLYAITAEYGEQEIYFDSKVSEFSQQADWMNVDSVIDYISPQQMQYNGALPEDQITLQPAYFSQFDYIPNTDNKLISSDSLKDLIFIKSESDVYIKVNYYDKYNNTVCANYPKLYYRKGNSSDLWTEASFSGLSSNIFATNLSLDYGVFEYYIVADNEKYPEEYVSPVKTFVVTERPHSFVNLNTNLQDGKGNSNSIVKFDWTSSKGVESDILKYTLYIGTSEDSMQMYDLATQNSYTAENLSARSRYYWKVEVENQYGAKLLNPEVFTFVTLGEIRRVYNAPNPFNPQKGEKTRIFFEMPEAGSVQMDIYSEYGDKIFHLSEDNLKKGNNEILYDGKDDYGNTLYNGTYLCIIKKKYSGKIKTERCRLLIIK